MDSSKTPTHILMLNDMRNGHVENLAIAAAGTFEELVALLAGESVPPYVDAVRSRDASFVLRTWHKSFRAGGPLEWFNKPAGLEAFLVDPSKLLLHEWPTRSWFRALVPSLMPSVSPDYIAGYVDGLKYAGYGRER